MYVGKTVFAQLMDFIPQLVFRAAVRHHKGNRGVRTFTCWQQFLSLVFAHLTARESLRDIESCLRSRGKLLYHSGITGYVSRSTLADANEHRPWQIYQELGLELISIARKLYHDHQTVQGELQSTVYAFDSTNIELCLTLFPWAHASVYQKTSAGVKMHTLLDVRSQLPVVIHVTAANVSDMTMLDALMLEPGAYYIVDRGYTDFTRLRRIDLAGAFFVIRARDNLRFHRVYSRPVDKTTGVRADQEIVLDVALSRQHYPDRLRRIRYFDQEHNRTLIFLTNNFLLDAYTIAELYRSRWKVELFFRWVKQHLGIKSFYGTSPNAVKTQLWIAISTYVLVAIVKKELKCVDLSLYTILQVLSISLFDKTPLNQLLANASMQFQEQVPSNQLKLFTF